MSTRKLTLIQAFRRIGQSMSDNDGWNRMFIEQDWQMKIVSKLYAKYGLTIKGGGFCPEQYDVFKDEAQIAYFRLRHGEFTVNTPDCETIAEFYPNGDGGFDGDERLNYLTKALRLLTPKTP